VIKPKEKQCKPINKAYGYESCGKMFPPHKIIYAGCCQVCYWDWMQTTEAGQIHYQKQFLPKSQQKTRSREREEKRKTKIDLMTTSAYRSKILLPILQKTARMIDYGTACIASDRFEGKMAGGHYFSVGSNATTSLNLHNIHIQSFQSNSWKGGDDKKYQEGLIKRYGHEYFEFVNALKKTPALHLTKDDMTEMKTKAQQICNEIEKSKRLSSPEARISLRNKVNENLGIYPKEFSVFTK